MSKGQRLTTQHLRNATGLKICTCDTSINGWLWPRHDKSFLTFRHLLLDGLFGSCCFEGGFTDGLGSVSNVSVLKRRVYARHNCRFCTEIKNKRSTKVILVICSKCDKRINVRNTGGLHLSKTSCCLVINLSFEWMFSFENYQLIKSQTTSYHTSRLEK